MAASESRTVEDAVRFCLSSICVHTGWCLGLACLVTTAESGEREHRASLWHVSEPARFEPFREFSETQIGALESGLMGRVLKSRELVWLADLQSDPHFSSNRVAREAGIKSAFALPIVAGSDIVAILELFSESPMQMDQKFLDVLENVGRQLGRVSVGDLIVGCPAVARSFGAQPIPGGLNLSVLLDLRGEELDVVGEGLPDA